MLFIALQLYVVIVGVFQAFNMVKSQAIHPENSHEGTNIIKNVINEQVTLNDVVLELKKQVQDLKSNVLKQDVVNTKLREEIKEQLANENSKHELDILKLENKNSKHEQDIIKLENENSNHKEELLHLKAQLKSQELYIHDQLNSYQSKNLQNIQALNTTLLKHIEKMNSFVTFTAYATVPRDYNIDDVVRFDGIVMSSEFYDSTTSIFTCPYSGFYLFAVSLRGDGMIMSVDIRVDGIHLVSVLTSGTHPDQGSTLDVTRCDEGQQVWIRSRDDESRMSGTSGRHCTFTGTLLRVI